ncbi:MAG: regulatory protein RecX [Weeksellaceae bacterium]|jgi:regulatory protein|nr:regulatory protein RecX [Weeksellaceae bacterium]
MLKEVLTVDEIREKLAKYCVYQDRCQWEVEQKFNEFNLIPEAKDQIMIYLIQNDFVNEERFAKNFVRSKFNQKKWGVNKISMELKKRKIPVNLIRIAMEEIDKESYMSTLNQLYNTKKYSLKHERDSLKKKGKIRRYLLQKGYESELIYELLRFD